MVAALLSAGADVNAVMLPPPAPRVKYRTLTERVEPLVMNAGANDMLSNAAMIPPASPSVPYVTLTQRVESLIKNTSAPSVASNEVGYTALMLAAAHGQTEVVKLLLTNEYVREDINRAARNNPKLTAIGIAVENGHKDICRLLQSNGAVLPPHHHISHTVRKSLN